MYEIRDSNNQKQTKMDTDINKKSLEELSSLKLERVNSGSRDYDAGFKDAIDYIISILYESDYEEEKWEDE